MLITPNRLTYLRFLFSVIAIYCLLQTQITYRWIAIFMLILSGLTDYWDGLLARKTGLITTIGKILDPIADKVLVLGAMITYSIIGLYSLLWVIPILIREVLITIIRIVLLKKGVVVQAEKSGKLKMIFQLASIYSSFVYLMARDYQGNAFFFWFEVYAPILNVIQYFFLFAALLWTLYSGVEFFRNNKKVLSG